MLEVPICACSVLYGCLAYDDGDIEVEHEQHHVELKRSYRVLMAR